MKNKGIQNEYWFTSTINNKTIENINNPLLEELILYLFPTIEKNIIIKCYKNVFYEKGDICIQVGNQIKYVSIKMGIRNTVHGEKLSTFKQFLIKNGISKETINYILEYHYADGTIDGTGKKRLTVDEYKKENKDKIEFVNKEINNLNFLKKAINRFIISGTQSGFQSIDALICGTPRNFLYITPNEIYKYILCRKNIESSSIHFSCLTYQPQARVLDYEPSKEYMRNFIQIKWYNFEDNVIEILNQRSLTKNR